MESPNAEVYKTSMVVQGCLGLGIIVALPVRLFRVCFITKKKIGLMKEALAKKKIGLMKEALAEKQDEDEYRGNLIEVEEAINGEDEDEYRGNLIEVEEAIINRKCDLNTPLFTFKNYSAPYSIEIYTNRGKVISFATKVIHFLAEWQLMLYILAGLNLSVTAKSGWWIPLVLDGLFTVAVAIFSSNSNTISIHWLFFLMHAFRNCNRSYDHWNNFTAQDTFDHLFLILGMVVGFMILYGILKKINVSHLPYYISLVAVIYVFLLALSGDVAAGLFKADSISLTMHNLKQHGQFTLLGMAVKNFHHDAVQRLLYTGEITADIFVCRLDEFNKSGCSAMGLAAYYGNIPAIQMLQEQGFNVNWGAQDSRGRQISPFILARANGQHAACELLEKLGADTDIKYDSLESEDFRTGEDTDDSDSELSSASELHDHSSSSRSSLGRSSSLGSLGSSLGSSSLDIKTSGGINMIEADTRYYYPCEKCTLLDKSRWQQSSNDATIAETYFHRLDEFPVKVKTGNELMIDYNGEDTRWVIMFGGLCVSQGRRTFPQEGKPLHETNRYVIDCESIKPIRKLNAKGVDVHRNYMKHYIEIDTNTNEYVVVCPLSNRDVRIPACTHRDPQHITTDFTIRRPVRPTVNRYLVACTFTSLRTSLRGTPVPISILVLIHGDNVKFSYNIEQVDTGKVKRYENLTQTVFGNYSGWTRYYTRPLVQGHTTLKDVLESAISAKIHSIGRTTVTRIDFVMCMGTRTLLEYFTALAAATTSDEATLYKLYTMISNEPFKLASPSPDIRRLLETVASKRTVQTSVVNSADSEGDVPVVQGIIAHEELGDVPVVQGIIVHEELVCINETKNLSTTQIDNIQISSHSDDDYHAFKWAVSKTSDESTKSTNIEIDMDVKSYEKQFWEKKWQPTHCTFTLEGGHLHFKDTVVLPNGMGMVSVKKNKKQEDRYDVFHKDRARRMDFPVAELQVSKLTKPAALQTLDVIASPAITYNDNLHSTKTTYQSSGKATELHFKPRVWLTPSFKCKYMPPDKYPMDRKLTMFDMTLAMGQMVPSLKSLIHYAYEQICKPESTTPITKDAVQDVLQECKRKNWTYTDVSSILSKLGTPWERVSKHFKTSQTLEEVLRESRKHSVMFQSMLLPPGAYSGVLEKKGKINTAYKKRVFILFPNTQQLHYYENITDDTPKGIIYLTLGTQVNPIDGSEQQREFTVTSGERTYTLKAEDEPSRTEWIDKINKVISSSNSLATIRGGAVCMNRRMTKRPKQSQASPHTKRRYKSHPRKRTRTSTGPHHATTTKAATGHRRRAGGTRRGGARQRGGRRRSRGR